MELSEGNWIEFRLDENGNRVPVRILKSDGKTVTDELEENDPE